LLQSRGLSADDCRWPRPTSGNIYGCGKIWVRVVFPRVLLVLTVISPHLLAPTASDLVKYNKKDTILAGFHTDLNFLTIHGRSRYPGLHIWARNTGKRILVQFPPTGRYLLVQAGKQLEHLTGGLIRAGYHEVVVNEATITVSSFRIVAFSFRCTYHSLRPFRDVKQNPQIALSSEYLLHSFGTCHPTTILCQFHH
jgi:2OG-Fe(II) oxygenase superfamily